MHKTLSEMYFSPECSTVEPIHLWVVVSELGESLIVRSEVVAPLTDAVGLVDDESRQLPSAVEVS